jgi:hypothetical protein
MRFGLLCSAQADGRELGPGTGQGFRDYLDFNVEAETLGLHSSFLVEHHFTGWNQGKRCLGGTFRCARGRVMFEADARASTHVDFRA